MSISAKNVKGFLWYNGIKGVMYNTIMADMEEKIKEVNRYNYERRKDYFTKKINCGCGGHYRPTHKTKHFKTKKHIDWKSKEDSIEQYYTLVNRCKCGEIVEDTDKIGHLKSPVHNEWERNQIQG